MDARVSIEHMKEEDDSSMMRADKSNVGCFLEVKKGDVEAVPTGASNGLSLRPITPDSTRDIEDACIEVQSPLVLLPLPPKLVCIDQQTHKNDDLDVVHCSPRTPKVGVFDPFAPGPDDMLLAPQCKKYLGESRISIVRRLNFDSYGKSSVWDENRGNNADSLSDDEEMIFQTVYGSLLEAIISKQTESFLVEKTASELDSDGFKTPAMLPLLTGVAEICPGAPMKCTRKMVKVDLGLCRKLEF